MTDHQYAAALAAVLKRIADGRVMTGEFTHAETVLAYQEIAREAVKAWDRHNAPAPKQQALL